MAESPEVITPDNIGIKDPGIPETIWWRPIEEFKGDPGTQWLVRIPGYETSFVYWTGKYNGWESAEENINYPYYAEITHFADIPEGPNDG